MEGMRIAARQCPPRPIYLRTLAFNAAAISRRNPENLKR
jgi:hypothetical protein